MSTALTDTTISFPQINTSTEAPDTVSQIAETTQDIDTNSLRFTLQPQNAIVKEGETITLKVEAEGGEKPYRYMWLTLYPGGEMIAHHDIHTDTLSFTAVEINEINRNGIPFFCRVTDANGIMIQSETVTVTVIPKS